MAPVRLFIALLLLLLSVSVAQAAKRVALVVGIDEYEQIADLYKATNDADAIAATLEEIGYDVLLARDVSRREMNRQLQLFSSRIEPGDEALFYFAGHGVEIAGRNYLLPTDIPTANPGQEDFVTSEAIPVDVILDRIRNRGAKISILILDACRNNPFPRTGTRSLGATRGLARSIAPEGTFIMYSAGVGQEALDGLNANDADPNSVFTRSLIPLLKTPGMSLTQTARQVRRDVQKLASTVSHEQRPAYYDEVTGDFFFAGAGAEEATPASTSKSVDDRTAALEKQLEEMRKQLQATKLAKESSNRTSTQSDFEVIFEDNADLARRKRLGMLTQQEFQSLQSSIESPPQETVSVNEASNTVRSKAEFQQADPTYIEDELRNAYGEGNYPRSFGIATQAAKRELAFAQLWMGIHYDYGHGTAKDESEAFRWYLKAANQNDTDAMLRVASMYEDGRGVAQNYTNAVRWYQLLIDGGASYLKWRVGVHYLHGTGGLPKDGHKAAEYAAEEIKRGNQNLFDHLDVDPNKLPIEFRIELQRILKNAGIYSGSLDGIFGPATEAAIRKYAGKS